MHLHARPKQPMPAKVSSGSTLFSVLGSLPWFALDFSSSTILSTSSLCFKLNSRRSLSYFSDFRFQITSGSSSSSLESTRPAIRSPSESYSQDSAGELPTNDGDEPLPVDDRAEVLASDLACSDKYVLLCFVLSAM